MLVLGSFSGLCNSPSYECTSFAPHLLYLFTCWWTSGLFPPLAIMNNVAMNKHIFPFLLGIYTLKMELLGHLIIQCLLIWEIAWLFSIFFSQDHTMASWVFSLPLSVFPSLWSGLPTTATGSKVSHPTGTFRACVVNKKDKILSSKGASKHKLGHVTHCLKSSLCLK